MVTDHSNQESDDTEHMYGMRKLTYWEKYGVKRFPYRGKRKYTPLVNQSDDGGIVISNDVFGLTITQFEQMYKDCLNRRKTHENWIMNLRYPDKASNEYLEYLINCTDCNKEHLSWTENDSTETNLVKHLIRTVGTEKDILNRQLLFILHDKIHNANDKNITEISSGSLAEGLDLPGSDIDVMYVDEAVNVTQIVRNSKHQVQRTELFMETDTDNPGFTKLRLIAGGQMELNYVSIECFVATQAGLYLSTTNFLNHKKQQNWSTWSTHGPCLSDKNRTIAFCLRSKYLPYHAKPWISRYRRQWPPNAIIDRIIKIGCLLVPIGPRIMPDCNLLWRISFSVAEKQLVHSFNFTQLLCYGLLKLTLKRIVNTNDDVKDLLCSYYLKTALFWVSEEVDISTFQLPNLFSCFSLCIDKLISWVNNCYCPNYFIPENNMFSGKINQYNNNSLLSVMNSIKYSGISGLMQNLFHSYNCNISCYPPYSETKEQSILMLDFLFYRTSHGVMYGTEILLKRTKHHNLLAFIESLQNSQSSTFITDVCKYYYASISQYAAQLLPPPKTINTNYNICKRYHRHLQNGIQRDAVTGWLLYASFYYVTKQYNVTLKLTEYVLSKCSPGMVFIDRSFYTEEVIDNYRHHVHYSMTLNAKMKAAVVNDLCYLQQSSLIPQELELEVENTYFKIPPIVMIHCLRFLCYHHIGNTFNKQLALYHLCLPQFLLDPVASNTFTLTGVCFEMSGDKDTAVHCYDKALQCDKCICFSAEKRKARLVNI